MTPLEDGEIKKISCVIYWKVCIIQDIQGFTQIYPQEVMTKHGQGTEHGTAPWQKDRFC